MRTGINEAQRGGGVEGEEEEEEEQERARETPFKLFSCCGCQEGSRPSEVCGGHAPSGIHSGVFVNRLRQVCVVWH